MSFSPDGTWVLTGGQDGVLRLWDARTGELARHLSGHRDLIVYAAFLPDGKSCVSVSSDNTAKLWTLFQLAIDNCQLPIEER